MIYSYTDCVNFFRMMALMDDEVGAFFVGEDKRLLDAARSEIVYPYVWLEYADGTVGDNGQAMHQTYECKLYVVSNNTLDDIPGQEQSLDLCEGILIRLLKRLRVLKQKSLLSVESNGSKWMRVSVSPSDNNWGWEITLRVGNFNQSVCVPSASTRSVMALMIDCDAVAGNDSLTLVGGGNTYSVDWDGVCDGDSLPIAIYQLSLIISADESWPVSAETFGKYLFLRADAPEFDIVIDSEAGDFVGADFASNDFNIGADNNWLDLFPNINQ